MWLKHVFSSELRIVFDDLMDIRHLIIVVPSEITDISSISYTNFKILFVAV